MSQNSLYNLQNMDSYHKDEIDLQIIINLILRNRFFISLITILSIFFSYVYSLKAKKIWQGEFQIVLNSEKNSTRLNLNPSIQSFVNLGSQNNNLKTEVGILESPSVLMPVFDYLVNNKKERNPKKEISFARWKNKNLKIKLESGTSILSITYKDDDKNIIIPVLEKMTSTYQKYSGRNKRKSQELRSNYLQSQINIFKRKSANSLRVAQEFAIDQDLNFSNIPRSISTENSNVANSNFNNPLNNSQDVFLPNIEIENMRVKAANEIKRIDLQIKNIEELGDDLQRLQYIGSTIPSIIEEGLPKSLADIEEELVEKRSKYTDNDLTIIRLIEKRNLLIELLKKRTIGYLKAMRLDTKATLESAKRPKGVLLQYKEFLREAQRDELTLVSLENQLRFNDLEEAKLNKPWELITVPTLLKEPVSPNIKILLLFGLVFGFILGTLISYFKEKKTDRIFDESTLEKNYDLDFIQILKLNEISSKSKKIIFLKEFVQTKAEEKLCLIYQDELEKIILDKLNGEIIGDDYKNKISFNSSGKELNNCKNLESNIFIGELNSVKYSDINNIINRLKNLNAKLIGIVLIDL